jgi:hypothetical protein
MITLLLEQECYASVCKSQPTYRDLAQVIFPPEARKAGYFCMVYQCFLDDSSDETQSEIFMSAGFFGLVDEWDGFNPEWSACLTRNKLSYYKTSEWKRLEGQFSQFREYPRPEGRDRANAVRSEPLAIAKKYTGIRGIGVAIPIPIYNQIAARPEAKDIFDVHPYRRAFDGVLNETLKIVERMPEHHVVAFIHDDGQNFDELRRYYKEYVLINTRHASHMFDALVPKDDKKHPPLQLADALANFGMCCGREWLKTSNQTDAEEFNIAKLGAWDEAYMLGLLKHELNRRDRLIPSDLRRL